MNKIKVSIIIPIYNAEKYLNKCLDSVANQSLENIEIICVNDGSTDNSKKILEDYSKKNNNIVVINQENKGIVGAKLAGYKKAKGEYIGWVDNDDFVELNMFEKLYLLAESNNADIAICNYQFYPKEIKSKEKWYKSFDGEITWKFLSKSNVLWNKIVKKELLDKMNFIYLFNEFGEGCYSLIMMNSNKIVTTDEMLYYYRVGHNSVSNNFKNIKWFEETISRSKKKVEYVTNNNYSKEWIEFVTYGYLYYNLIMMIVSSYNNKKERYKESKKIIKTNRLFSRKYKKYLLNSFSISKYLFLKYIGYNSFFFMKIISKKVLK